MDLQAWMDKKDVTVYDVAKATGVTMAALTAILKGEMDMTAEVERRLCRYFEIEEE